MQGLEAFGEGLQGLLTLNPNQGGAQAVVDASAEGHVGIGPAGNVEVVGVLELAGVPVGRGDEPADTLVLLDHPFPQFHVLGGDAGDGLDGGVVAQALLVGLDVHALNVAAQEVVLVGVADEGQDAVAQQVNGGLVAGQEQKGGVGDDLVAAEDAFPLAPGQDGYEVVLRVNDALLHQGSNVLDHLADALGEVLHAPGFAAAHVEQLFGYFADVRAVLLGHAHHFGDNEQRQGRGEVAHHVHAAPFLRLVQQVLDDVLHHGPPLFHRAGGEVAVHHLAHVEVGGTVVLDELAGLVFAHELVKAQVGVVDGGIGRTRVVLEHRRREQFVVAGEPDQVVVAGDYPQLVEFVPVDGVFLPETAVIGVGVVDCLVGEHVVADSSNHIATNP